MLSRERLAWIRRQLALNPPPPLPAVVLDRLAGMLRPKTATAADHRPETVIRRPSPQPSNPAAVEVTPCGSPGDRAS